MLESLFKKLHIINYLLIVLIFLGVLLFTRDILSMGFSRKVSQTSKTENGTTTAIAKIKDIKSYAPILEQNPFGPPMKLIPITTERKVDRHGSIQELILVGTVVGPKSLSYAIFEDKSHPDTAGQELFAYGENVYDYGNLTKIEKGWVELTQRADTYIIPLTDIQVKERHTKNSEFSRSPFAKKLGEKQYLLDQRRVQQALNNPEQILTDARLLPNIQNGKQEGFRILEVKPGGLYESLGLRNGDILLRVNNLEISNPEVAMQAMSALKGMNTVSLDIIRKGSKITMDYQIR